MDPGKVNGNAGMDPGKGNGNDTEALGKWRKLTRALALLLKLTLTCTRGHDGSCM